LCNQVSVAQLRTVVLCDKYRRKENAERRARNEVRVSHIYISPVISQHVLARREPWLICSSRRTIVKGANASGTRSAQSGRRSPTRQEGSLTRLHALVISAEAHVTKGWLKLPWGRKRHCYDSYSCLHHIGHVFFLEVLHGVLYPARGAHKWTLIKKIKKEVSLGLPYLLLLS